MPFPDDYYTVKDIDTATGRRVNLTDAAMPQNVDGTPIAAAPYNLNDGFSPGQVITLRVPGLDTPAGAREHQPDPAQRPEPQRVAGLERADRRDRRRDQQAGPDLGRARLERDSPAGTALLIHPAHPVRVRAPLHRRDAQAQGRGGQQARRAGGLPLLPRRPALRRGGDHRASASASRTSSARCARRKSSATTSTWRGTSRSPATRTSPAACCTSATTRSRSSATPTSPTGSSRAPRPRSRSTTVDNDPERAEIARRVTGTFTVPCYLTNNCEAPAVFDLDANGNPIQHGTYDGQLRLHHPARRRRRSGASRRGRRSTATACSAAPTRSSSSPQRTLAQAHNFVFCATDEIGFADGGHPEHDRDPPGPRPASRSSPTASSRGCSNELFLGRLMDQPGRVRERRGVPRRRRRLERAGDRHVEALLQRQQPGRHPRRRADRGLARTSPGRRSACPAMGYSTLLTQVDRLRHVLDDPLSGVPERALAAAGAVADPDALGPLASRTATRTG